ncbi:hypothetical protein NVP1264O_50 [Vibrio phage 1.264.O._10N.286.51.F2]|nr:hypothetical protein NVP1264O_50 [Vibrio phage 1.264.O._10N.286.51.F2]
MKSLYRKLDANHQRCSYHGQKLEKSHRKGSRDELDDFYYKELENETSRGVTTP